MLLNAVIFSPLLLSPLLFSHLHSTSRFSFSFLSCSYLSLPFLTHSLPSPLLSSLPSPPLTLPADWLLLWPRLLQVPSSTEGAGREEEHTLGKHRQASIIITGQAEHRGSGELLTLIIWVCLMPTPWICFQATAILSPIQNIISSKGWQTRSPQTDGHYICSNDDWLQLFKHTQMCAIPVSNDLHQPRSPSPRESIIAETPRNRFTLRNAVHLGQGRRLCL